nr:hypothetical protein [Xylanibacterium ulmi]
MGERTSGTGFGRLVVTIYGVLAFAALGRSSYQIATSAPHVPLAYWLSALAAVVYVVAAIAIARGRGRWRALAWATVTVEAVGVLSVGVASLFSDELQHDGTVWRLFGMDYGFFPLILPFVGLWWLWRTRPAAAAAGTTIAPEATASRTTPSRTTPESEA